jgi:hypothetical protein
MTLTIRFGEYYLVIFLMIILSRTSPLRIALWGWMSPVPFFSATWMILLRTISTRITC